jgi:hypothetical protein
MATTYIMSDSYSFSETYGTPGGAAPNGGGPNITNTSAHRSA